MQAPGVNTVPWYEDLCSVALLLAPSAGRPAELDHVEIDQSPEEMHEGGGGHQHGKQVGQLRWRDQSGAGDAQTCHDCDADVELRDKRDREDAWLRWFYREILFFLGKSIHRLDQGLNKGSSFFKLPKQPFNFSFWSAGANFVAFFVMTKLIFHSRYFLIK